MNRPYKKREFAYRKLKLIQLLTSDISSISIEAITSKSRKKRTCNTRQVAMYLCRQLTGASLPAIGILFGGRHHSTVIGAIKKAEKLVNSDARARDIFENVRLKFMEIQNSGD